MTSGSPSDPSFNAPPATPQPSPPPFPTPARPEATAPPTVDLDLNPATLIDASRGAGRPRLPLWPFLMIGLLAMMLWSRPDGSPLHRVGMLLSLVAIVGGYAAIAVWGRRLQRRVAAESEAVAALEEFVQLRRWPEAATLAAHVLGRPMLAADRRAAALLSLSTVLSRYHLFADARVVHEYLLAPGEGEPAVDASVAHAVRVARAMTLLREDLLVDADRAMTELRRELAGARDAVRRARGAEAAADVRSAGLVLLDLYRDVKTGHPDEAIAAFESSIAWLPASLGLRVADAWVLVAAAYDRVGRDTDRDHAYANATTLVPAVELHRRYPETAALARRCRSHEEDASV